MKIYLAARYSRRMELCGYREQLQALGHTVTSRWLNGNHQIDTSGKPIGETGEALVEGDDGSQDARATQLRESFAREDMNDVAAADLLIAFTEPPRSNASRGGRHVELGIALGMGKDVTVIGHRENIFCWLPEVVFYDTFEDMLATWAVMGAASDAIAASLESDD